MKTVSIVSDQISDMASSREHASTTFPYRSPSYSIGWEVRSSPPWRTVEPA